MPPAFALAALTLLLPTIAAAEPDLLWTHRFGTTVEDHGYALATDGAGGVFIGGHTMGNLGGFNAGLFDAFIAHHNAAGDQTWVTQFGTNFDERVFALAPDGSGGAFIAGYTRGSLGGLNAGQSDAFLARYDSTGSQLWIRQFGTADDDHAYALAPDGQAGVFIAGYTHGDLGAPSAGQWGAFLARYTSAGARTWLTQFGTDRSDLAYAITPDGQGGAFIAGETNGNLGGQNAGGYDAFLAHHDSAGHQTWIRQFGTDKFEAIYTLEADGAGGVFAAGTTDGDLGQAVIGGVDAFLARYNAAGDPQWLTQFGSTDDDTPWALARDFAGGVLIAGDTYGYFASPSLGWNDAFLARFDTAGNQDWAAQFGTDRSDSAYGIADADAGSIFVAGDTWSDHDDKDPGSSDVFLARFNICPAECDGNNALDLFDFLCFVNHFNAGDDSADCDRNGSLDIFDFLCFVNAFNAGC